MVVQSFLISGQRAEAQQFCNYTPEKIKNAP